MRVFRYVVYVLLIWFTVLVVWQKFGHIWRDTIPYSAGVYGTGGSLQSPNDIEFVYRLLKLHNKVRQERGLPLLRLSYNLQKSAYLKAFDMLVSDYWAHNNPVNPDYTPWFFIRRYTPVYKVAGENLAKGFLTPEQAMQAWLNSPTHRANILDERFTHIGIFRLHGRLGRRFTDVTVVHFASLGEEAQPYDTAYGLSTNGKIAADTLIPGIWVYTPNVLDVVGMDSAAYSRGNSNNLGGAASNNLVLITGVARVPGVISLPHLDIEVQPGPFYKQAAIDILQGGSDHDNTQYTGAVNTAETTTASIKSQPIEMLLKWGKHRLAIPLKILTSSANVDPYGDLGVKLVFDGIRYTLNEVFTPRQLQLAQFYGGKVALPVSFEPKFANALAEGRRSYEGFSRGKGYTLGVTDQDLSNRGGIYRYSYILYNPFVLVGLIGVMWLGYVLAALISLKRRLGVSFKQLIFGKEANKELLSIKIETGFLVFYIAVLLVLSVTGSGGV